MTDEDVRTLLDRLLQHGALRRGLVLGCASCSSKHFVAIDDVGQVNRCPRCSDRSPLTRDRWRTPDDEPTWFYELHGALRDLMKQNGDVPLLGAAYFAANAQTYDDLVETRIDLQSTSTEVDLIAVVDGKLTVGEAKKAAKAKVGTQLSKLVTAANQLRADRVALLAGDAPPSSEANIDHVRREIAYHVPVDGRRPELWTVTNLFGDPKKEIITC